MRQYRKPASRRGFTVIEQSPDAVLRILLELWQVLDTRPDIRPFPGRTLFELVA